MNSVLLSSVPTQMVFLFIVAVLLGLLLAHAPRVLSRLAPSFLAAFVLLQTHIGNAQTPTPAETQPTTGPASVLLRELPDLSVAAPPIPGDYVRSDQGWVTFGYTTYAAPRMEPVFKAANEAREKIELEFGQSVLAKVEVRVARNPEEMKKLAPYGRPPPSYASGVAYPDLHLVLLTLVAPGPVADAPDLTEVFVHELSHVALFDAVQGAHVPRWFNEGVAIYVSGEHPFARTQTLSNASFSKSLLPMTGLDAKFPANHYEVGVAYAQSADFVRFLLRDADKARFQSLIARVRAGTVFERAIEDAYGTDFRKLEYQWKEDVAKRYAFLPSLAGGSFLWALVIVAMFVGYMKRRKRNKVFYQKWENEEAREAEARRMQLAAENSLAEELRNNTMRPKQELPKVEHDGHWHTLH